MPTFCGLVDSMAQGYGQGASRSVRYRTSGGLRVTSGTYFVSVSVQTAMCLQSRMVHQRTFERTRQMLETVAIILLILWVLGLVSSYTMGGLIHILLVIAVVVVLV